MRPVGGRGSNVAGKRGQRQGLWPPVGGRVCLVYIIMAVANSSRGRLQRSRAPRPGTRAPQHKHSRSFRCSPRKSICSSERTSSARCVRRLDSEIWQGRILDHFRTEICRRFCSSSNGANVVQGMPNGTTEALFLNVRLQVSLARACR